VHEPPSVLDNEPHGARSYLFGLERDRELAESELETAPTRVHTASFAERRRRRRSGRVGAVRWLSERRLSVGERASG
jgi:hypothetical protein